MGGRLTVLPPLLGDSYALRVPKPDEDGLDIAGIRPIEIRAPLGTNTGWNVRAEGLRRPHLCALSGSFIPFAVTRAERERTGDPRRSLRERYHNHHGYVQACGEGVGEGAFPLGGGRAALHPPGGGQPRFARVKLADLAGPVGGIAETLRGASAGYPWHLAEGPDPAARAR